jgi:hypothetical protein
MLTFASKDRNRWPLSVHLAFDAGCCIGPRWIISGQVFRVVRCIFDRGYVFKILGRGRGLVPAMEQLSHVP